MTLAGTRPPTVDEWDKYELHHRARLATKPGLTGMWQVSGRSNITDLETLEDNHSNRRQWKKRWKGRRSNFQRKWSCYLCGRAIFVEKSIYGIYNKTIKNILEVTY